MYIIDDFINKMERDGVKRIDQLAVWNIKNNSCKLPKVHALMDKKKKKIENNDDGKK